MDNKLEELNLQDDVYFKNKRERQQKKKLLDRFKRRDKQYNSNKEGKE